MPDDESLEYLATQAIADFLATEITPPLVGIISPSVQTAGEALNVVLFHKSSRIENIELPKGTDIKANLGYTTEDGWEEDYAVYEEVPKTPEESINSKALTFMPFPDLSSFDARPCTLKINLEDVSVHVVEAVKYKTDSRIVRRHRWVKADPVSPKFDESMLNIDF
jgi:hypothetical protein